MPAKKNARGLSFADVSTLASNHGAAAIDPDEIKDIADELSIDTSEDAKSKRPFDVIVWGATGYTGKMAAEYLASAYPREKGQKIRYAIAGRDERKLQAVRAAMAAIDPNCAEMPILTADIGNQASVDAMIAQTRVVVACAGPFTHYGTPIVDACVRLRTDYVDITGETTWVATLIDKYHAQAAREGVMIVPMCGFDSIPSDVGCYMAVDYMKRELKCTPVSDEGFFKMWGPAGPSGGTFNTMFTLAGDSKLGNPHLMTPPEGRPAEPSPFEADRRFVRYSKDLGAATMPFVMAVANTRVVRRSKALLGYGREFVYNESMVAKSRLQGAIASIAMIIFFLLTMIPCTRWALRRLLTQPGDGPSLEKRQKSGVKVTHICKSAEGKKVMSTFTCVDPGYGTTAKMVVESALTIARSKNQALVKGGVLTASCIGPALQDNLRKVGVTLTVEEVTDEKKAK